MIPNGKEMDWHGHKLVFESENDQCRGCFFADKDECPECDEGLWVEENPSPWHTGTPTEGGLYLVVTHEGYDVWRFNKNFKAWNLHFDKVKAWMPIPPFEANPSEEGREE